MRHTKSITLAVMLAVSGMANANEPVADPNLMFQIYLQGGSAPNYIPGFTAVYAPSSSYYNLDYYLSPPGPSDPADIGTVPIDEPFTRVLAVQNISGKSMTSVASAVMSASDGHNIKSSIVCTPPLTLKSAAVDEVCDLIITGTPNEGGWHSISVTAKGTTGVDEEGATAFSFEYFVEDPNAVEVDADIGLSESTLAFPDTVEGESSTLSLTVSNVSSTNDLVELRTLISGQYFSIESTECGTNSTPIDLLASQTCQVTVRFSPLADGDFMGTLSLDSPSAAAGVQSALLTGKGLPFIPPSADFSVSLQSQVASAKGGDLVKFDATVTNAGPDTASFTLSSVTGSASNGDTLTPTSVKCATINGSACPSSAISSISLTSGSTAVITIEVPVINNQGTVTMSATSAPVNSAVDSNATNNTGSATVEVTPYTAPQLVTPPLFSNFEFGDIQPVAAMPTQTKIVAVSNHTPFNWTGSVNYGQISGSVTNLTAVSGEVNYPVCSNATFAGYSNASRVESPSDLVLSDTPSGDYPVSIPANVTCYFRYSIENANTSPTAPVQDLPAGVLSGSIVFTPDATTLAQGGNSLTIPVSANFANGGNPSPNIPYSMTGEISYSEQVSTVAPIDLLPIVTLNGYAMPASAHHINLSLIQVMNHKELAMVRSASGIRGGGVTNALSITVNGVTRSIFISHDLY